MNDLEKAILRGAKNAERKYEWLTGGHWLSHAPESFLQMTVAMELRKKTKNCIYVDASHNKIKADQDERRLGRPPGNEHERPDISVWFKTSNELRAIIEIKLAYRFAGVNSDATKIRKILRHKQSALGYLLVYSEEYKLETLKQRFRKWKDRLDRKSVV